jgi:hypothetical protein
MPKKPPADDDYSEEEATRRRDAVVKAMLATRPKPHAPSKSKRKSSRPNAATPKPKKPA